VLLVLLALSSSAGATCPDFAAWLRPENEVHPVMCADMPCDNIEGFVAVDVSPDGSFLTVTIQMTALPHSSAVPQFMEAGIYGPAKSHVEMPAGTKPLVVITTPSLTLQNSRFSGVFKRKAADMPTLLRYMREEALYVSVPSDRVPEGEIRGQLHVPMCLEAELHPPVPSFPPGYGATGAAYGFANVMIDKAHKKGAVLVQFPQDAHRSMSSKTFFAEGKIQSPPLAVHVKDQEGNVLAVVQTQAYDSCRTGSFDGFKADGITKCNFDEKHSYPSELNMANTGVILYHIEMALTPEQAAAFTNSTIAVETAKSQSMGYVAELSGTLMPALPCRMLLTQHDDLYTMAAEHRSDWITVWSLNHGRPGVARSMNPDVRPTLEPRYYAHPMVVTKGETAMAITRRFGMSLEEILKINPGLMDPDALPVGSSLCIIPNWKRVIAGSGQRICIS